MGKNKIALFDLDGTMADYDKAMKRDLGKIMAPDEELPVNFHTVKGHWEARTKLIRMQPGWWRNLEVIQAGRWVLGKALEIGFECHVLTKGPWSTTPAWTEKVEWCREKLPESVKVTITEDKSLVYGAVLMDDYPPYIEAWLANRPRGIVIMPDQPGNQGFEHPQVIRYHHNRPAGEANCHEVKRWLQQAFDRSDGKPIKHLYELGVPIKSDGMVCMEEECKFRQECANHFTAGDHRTEGGFTPELVRTEDQLHCATKERSSSSSYRNGTYPANHEKLSQGFLTIEENGTYNVYTGPYDEEEY